MYTNIDGKRTRMGEMDFRVKEVPPPKPYIGGRSQGTIEKSMMLAADGIKAILKDFDFKGVRYRVIAYTISATYKGENVEETVKGERFTPKAKQIINNTKSGNPISFSEIKARRIDAKGTATKNIGSLVLKIK